MSAKPINLIDPTIAEPPPLHGEELPETSKLGRKLHEQAHAKAEEDRAKQAAFGSGKRRYSEGK